MGSSARATLETLEGQLESKLNSLDEAGLLSCDVDPVLENILALTRSPGNHTIFGERSVRVLGRCAFDTPTEKPGSRHLAMRCLNNILTLAEPTRQSFVDAGYPVKLIDLMKVKTCSYTHISWARKANSAVTLRVPIPTTSSCRPGCYYSAPLAQASILPRSLRTITLLGLLMR